MIAKNTINASNISLLVDEVREIMIDRGYENISVIGTSQSIVQFFANWVANYEAEVCYAEFNDTDKLHVIHISYDTDSDMEIVDVDSHYGFTDCGADDMVFLFDDIPAKIQLEFERENIPVNVLGIIDDNAEYCDNVADTAYDILDSIPAEVVVSYEESDKDSVNLDIIHKELDDVEDLVSHMERILDKWHNTLGCDFLW